MCIISSENAENLVKPGSYEDIQTGQKKFQKVKVSPNYTIFKWQFCFHNSWVHLGIGGPA